MTRRIDLDANATTPCDPRVVEAMLPFFSGIAANPSSLHSPGQQARRAVEEARAAAARLAGGERAEVVFTSGGTEANNLALAGFARASRRRAPARLRVLFSAVEHPSIADCAAGLEEEGFVAVRIPVDRAGVVDLGRLRDECDDRTAVVAIMAASGEIGTVEPWREAAAIARAAGAPFHVDAVQAAGKIPVDFGASDAASMALSAHKIHGPKGVGALLLRRGELPEPLLRGGLQQKRIRPGTENVPGIVGFGVAARLAIEEMGDRSATVGALRERLEAALLAALPGSVVNGRAAPRVPNTISLTIPGVPAETLLIRLDLEGISSSTGTACSTGVVRPSPALLALGLSPAEAASTIRLSLSGLATAADVDRVAGILPAVAVRIRGALGG